MDDYTIKEKDKEVAGITVTYDDGSTKEIRRRRMNRKALEENLGRRIKVRLFDGAEYEGYLRKSGDERYRNDPNLYLPKNYYFLTDDYGVCKTCLFLVSHIQNYKILA